MRRATFGDYVANEARYAIHDVRQKLFEEAWCGRPMTPRPAMEIIQDREADRSHALSLDELWNGGSKNPSELQPDREAPDIDR